MLNTETGISSPLAQLAIKTECKGEASHALSMLQVYFLHFTNKKKKIKLHVKQETFGGLMGTFSSPCTKTGQLLPLVYILSVKLTVKIKVCSHNICFLLLHKSSLDQDYTDDITRIIFLQFDESLQSKTAPSWACGLKLAHMRCFQ